MAPNSRGNGSSGEPSARDALHIPRERCTKEAGAMIRPMVSVYIFTQTAQDMRASGGRTCNMARVPNHGQIPPNLLVNTLRDAKMESGNTSGQTVPFTKASGKTMKLRVMVITSGVTVVGTSVIGREISWMTSVSTPGKMVACTRATTEMIKNMDTVSTLGPIRKSILVGGIKESSMV
jgi:hypothetical protein